jgi:hypothetical protein
MRALGVRMGSLVILGTLAASAGACKQPSGTEPPAAATAPAVWEPIDKDFQGCEGG